MASAVSTSILAVAACVASLVVTAAQDTCYSTSSDHYLLMASKTAYQNMYNKNGIPPLSGCKVVQLWLLNRHGTRYPSKKNIKRLVKLVPLRDLIVSNYYANRTTICQKDIDSLSSWQFNVSMDQENLLTDQGRKDLYQLGQRLASYFPEVFNSPYSSDKFIFRHSNTSRTEESAQYFAKGVFGTDFNTTLPYSDEDKTFLQPYEDCDSWQNRKEWRQQQSEFDNSTLMTELVSRVSRRLGFESDLLQAQNVSLIYDMCRYQQAWDVAGLSPWCAAFANDELQVMEYREDVKYYYYTGPGSDMNSKLACPLVKDMVNQFSAVEKNPEATHPSALLYFGHETTVAMLSAHLGLTHDSLPLRWDNYPSQQNRQFRTSYITPFAGNVLVVLYNCSGIGLQTVFYQAEFMVPYAFCSEGRCDWKYLKNKLSPTVESDSCTDFSFCATNTGEHNVVSSALTGVLGVVTSVLRVVAWLCRARKH